MFMLTCIVSVFINKNMFKLKVGFINSIDPDETAYNDFMITRVDCILKHGKTFHGRNTTLPAAVVKINTFLKEL